ncbi:unnamed protein product [Coregonus sp. 'balchen']|nr:unnamed protein product [Coregonus sp. 'balchen']
MESPYGRKDFKPDNGMMSKDFTVPEITRYLFGEPVTGVGFVVFGVVQGDDRTSFPSSLQRVELKEGAGNAVLKMQHIKETFPDINNLLQKSLYISVNVLTDTGSEMVKAEKKGIYIVKSPYSIHFKKTPSYFKPGMPYDVSVYVTNPDDTPAKGIDVEVLHKDNKVKTNVKELADNRQGTQKMTLKPYQTKYNSRNYVHINIHSAEVKIEDQLKVDLSLGSSPAAQNDKHEITYLILSKGQLIYSQKLEWRKGQGLLSLTLTVNKDMIPSFRVVAYYHVGQTEVVSDSVWVEVKHTCMGSLKVDAVRPSTSYAPRKTVTLSIVGDPGARVGLVAVDKGVYILNDKNRLTQTKIWNIIEKHDTGCTAGSGMDSMGVFYDAGLVFASNTAGGTPQRTVSSCPVNSRRRRAVTINDVVTTLASQYTGMERQCCMDGMRKNILDYTCERRSQYISDGTECVEAFLKCCREMATKREDTKTDQLILARRICVSQPFPLIVSKNFFLDLKLPYSAVRNEQLEIKAILHNYMEDTITVRVELRETSDVCSSASKKGKYIVTVMVDARSTRSVPFVIIPMKLGLHTIEVKASVRDWGGQDGVKKDLRVVAEGVLTRLQVKNVELDPARHGGTDTVRVRSGALTNQVPNTPASTHISVTGEQLGRTIEAAISGSPLGDLLHQPKGCGEQNMMGMSLPVIATLYLDKTKQWEKVGLERRKEAVNFIQMGYDQEMSYRKADGSYATYLSERSAYVAKVFAMAEPFIIISKDVLCSAVKWLVVERQRPNGIFEESGTIWTPSMMGDVLGKDVDDTLTAFVLIAMQEAHKFCTHGFSISGLPVSMNRAKQYLESRNQYLTNPYSVAMTSYALANEGKLNKDILFKHSSTGGTDTVRVRSGTLTNQVPNTPASTHISVTGEQLGRTIEAAISGSPLGDLLHQPKGCGEQNMMGMSLPVIATLYLDKTKQWEKVGLERRTEAVNFIKMAYVAKVFAMADPFITISGDVLCSAVKWLVVERQRPNGIFEESGTIWTPSMMVLFVLLAKSNQPSLFVQNGDVLGKDVDDTLTAFVLIAMQEAHKFCTHGFSISGLPVSMNRAKQYLESRNQYLTNPYSVAMTSYALANEGKLNKDILFKHSSTDFLSQLCLQSYAKEGVCVIEEMGRLK